jgi:hypothetical protein
MYWIKVDYGYGDWGVVQEWLDEQEALDFFAERTGAVYSSMKEYQNSYTENGIYSIHEGEADEPTEWGNS